MWIILVPLLVGVGIYFLKSRDSSLHKALSLFAALAAFAGVLALLPLVLKGSAEFCLLDFMQLGLFFKVDLVDWVFAFLISFVWLLATLFSFVYMDFEHHRRRFYSVLIFTLGATLGVVLSADYFTLFLFFEMMTLSSFILVIHEQDQGAMKAGLLYIYLGLAGGLALLFAIMLLYWQAGTVEMMPLLDQVKEYPTLIFVLFLTGFGIKAGLVPLHIWLPKAHPVAPSPASALLSGIMIKTGAYGILKTALVLYQAPPGQEAAGYSSYLFNLGSGLMWVGIITMFSGAVMALLQDNMKRILAYSSVSQIGYIATGLGTALLMQADGAMGFTGALYHVINHAFFKAGLFLVAGTIYMYTRELELKRLGGMFKKMPLTGVVFLVCAFGIAGIPGFNGYASKTLIHDAMLLALEATGFYSIKAAEMIFTLTSALTICYFIKLFRGVFLGPVPKNLDRQYTLALSTKVVLGTFGAVIILIGLFPDFILQNFLTGSALLLSYTGPVMDHLYHFHFFAWPMLKPMVVIVALALAIYFTGDRYRWFNWQPPFWLSIEGLIYQPATIFLYNFTGRAGFALDRRVDQSYLGLGKVTGRLVARVVDFEGLIDKLYQRWGLVGRQVIQKTAQMDEGLDRFYQKSGRAAKKLAEGTEAMDSSLDKFYLKTGGAAKKLAAKTAQMDESLDKFYQKTGRGAKKLADQSARMDEGLDELYQKTGRAAKKLTDQAARADASLDRAYKKTSKGPRLLSEYVTGLEGLLHAFFDAAGKAARKIFGQRRPGGKDEPGPGEGEER